MRRPLSSQAIKQTQPLSKNDRDIDVPLPPFPNSRVASLLQRGLPTYDGRVDAINQMPFRNVGDGYFHNGSPQDPYSLPVTKTNATCTVDLEFGGASRDMYSWSMMHYQLINPAKAYSNSYSLDCEK